MHCNVASPIYRHSRRAFLCSSVNNQSLLLPSASAGLWHLWVLGALLTTTYNVWWGNRQSSCTKEHSPICNVFVSSFSCLPFFALIARARALALALALAHSLFIWLLSMYVYPSVEPVQIRGRLNKQTGEDGEQSP